MSKLATTLRPGMQFIVANSAANRATPFWEPLIGKKGLITGICADGLVDVTILDSHPLIPGVLPSRLVVLDPPPPTTWHHVLDRLLPTFLVLTMLILIMLICFVIPACVNGK